METKKLSIKSQRFIQRKSRFVEYAHLNPVQFVSKDYDPNEDISRMETLQQDDVVSLIFAPDPVTGIPRSDIAVVANKDTRPEISQYIQNVLQQPLQASEKVMDADMALDSVKDRYESFDQYAERLRALCADENKKPAKSPES